MTCEVTSVPANWSPGAWCQLHRSLVPYQACLVLLFTCMFNHGNTESHKAEVSDKHMLQGAPGAPGAAVASKPQEDVACRP